jgi:hypothetical protein
MAIFQPVGSLTEFVLYKNRSRIGEPIIALPYKKLVRREI